MSKLHIDAGDRLGNTLLMTAAQVSHRSTLKTMKCPRHVANQMLQNNHKEVVKECLKRGARINLQNKKVATAMFKSQRVIKCISQGQTALHFACAYGYTELAKYLISKGV
jgi:ankyrin repeat protein